MFTAMYMAKKTTITLRDDVYQTLKEKAGARNISNQINRILIDYFSIIERMFGTMKTADLKDLRDHKDRCL
jgi:predicted CopG family antitoxin